MGSWGLGGGFLISRVSIRGGGSAALHEMVCCCLQNPQQYVQIQQCDTFSMNCCHL